MSPLEKTLAYWFKGSDENFGKALRDFDAGDFAYALFWLHLATEKLLKALVVKKTKSPAPYTHDLVVIAKKAGLEISPDWESFLIELTVFQLETRYPEDFDEVKTLATREKAAALFKSFDNFKIWIGPIIQ